LSEGSKASLGSINYHYTRYYNTFHFLEKIIKMNKQLRKIVCIPNIGNDWLRSYLNISLTKETKSKYSVKPLTESVDEFKQSIKDCNPYRFIPINYNINVIGHGSHANIILIDTKSKTVEHFEPHGKRGNKSKLESVSRGYIKTSKNLEKFFKIHFPQYKFISPKEYESNYGLQIKHDIFKGACVSWCILYVHYRILNPDVSLKRLIKYLDKKVTKGFLSRYTRYIEDILKNK